VVRQGGGAYSAGQFFPRVRVTARGPACTRLAAGGRWHEPPRRHAETSVFWLPREALVDFEGRRGLERRIEVGSSSGIAAALRWAADPGRARSLPLL
jgi:hypothetical protein